MFYQNGILELLITEKQQTIKIGRLPMLKDKTPKTCFLFAHSQQIQTITNRWIDEYIISDRRSIHDSNYLMVYHPTTKIFII